MRNYYIAKDVNNFEDKTKKDSTNYRDIAILKAMIPKIMNAELNDFEKRCIDLRFENRLTLKEIGEILGKSESSVSRALVSAQNKIKEILIYCNMAIKLTR